MKHTTKAIPALAVTGLLAIACLLGGCGVGGQPPAEVTLPQTTAPQAATEPVTDPPTEPVSQRDTQEPATDTTQQTVTPVATEPAPSTEPTTGPTTQAATQTTTQPVTQAATDPATQPRPEPVNPEDAVIGDTAMSCTFSIDCSVLLDSMELLDEEKHELVPQDGLLLHPVTATFYEGESAFDVLRREAKRAGIHMEYVKTPVYNSSYIEGIGNLYELDAGELSGWMYKVNDWFPSYGSSRYQLQDGDRVVMIYTCDLGRDIGGELGVIGG